MRYPNKHLDSFPSPKGEIRRNEQQELIVYQHLAGHRIYYGHVSPNRGILRDQ